MFDGREELSRLDEELLEEIELGRMAAPNNENTCNHWRQCMFVIECPNYDECLDIRLNGD